MRVNSPWTSSAADLHMTRPPSDISGGNQSSPGGKPSTLRNVTYQENNSKSQFKAVAAERDVSQFLFLAFLSWRNMVPTLPRMPVGRRHSFGDSLCYSANVAAYVPSKTCTHLENMFPQPCHSCKTLHTPSCPPPQSLKTSLSISNWVFSVSTLQVFLWANWKCWMETILLICKISLA